MSEEVKTLGQVLKDSRKLRCLTVRQVEEDIGIPSAYLDKLENNEIQKPSAHVLWTLSKKYRICLKDLLIKAGIIINQ